VDLSEAAWGEEDDILSIEDDEPAETADDGAEQSANSEIFMPPAAGSSSVSAILR
jgi:hypothetical protein